MSQQLLLTLIAASVGFVASIFFCIGNAFNSPKQIMLQATPFWDFNEHLARSIASQRAQYVVGALLLVVSFALQVAAALASPTNVANIPQFLQFWLYLVLAVFFPTLILSGGLAWLLYKSTMRKVLNKNVKINKVVHIIANQIIKWVALKRALMSNVTFTGFISMLNKNDIYLLLFATIALIVGLSYSNKSISAIGLTLDITGVLLLWHFGLPSNIKPDGKVYTAWDEQVNEVEEKRFTFAKWASHGAILFIIFGFVLQFVGSIR